MQLLKLVYICHGWMLALHGRPLIQESVEAWTYGPVVPTVYRSYKSFGGGPIDPAPNEAPDNFEESEVSVIEQVWKLYGSYTGLQLSALTHQADTPWDITRTLGSGQQIGNDLIQEHYRRIADRG